MNISYKWLKEYVDFDLTLTHWKKYKVLRVV